MAHASSAAPRAADSPAPLGALFAFVAAAAVFAMLPNAWGAALAGAIAGVTVGTATASRRSAAIAAGFGALAGLLAAALSDALLLGTTPSSATAIAISLGTVVAIASASAVSAERTRPHHSTLTWAALALIVVAMVPAAAYQLNQPDRTVHGQTAIAWLANPPAQTAASDADLYAKVALLTRTGAPYYPTALAELTARGRSSTGALNVRMPTAYWLWAALPAGPGPALFGGLIALGMLATVAAFIAGRTLAPAPSLALTGSACVAAFYVLIATSEYLPYTEPWASAFVVLALAAWALAEAEAPASAASTRAQILFALSAALVLVAALIRETAVLVLAGGLLAAWLSDRTKSAPGNGHWRTWPWAVALALWAAAYALHVSQVPSGLFGGGSATQWLDLGVDRAIATVNAGTDFLAFGGVIALLLFAATTAGLARKPLTVLRRFGLLGVAVPLGTFCLVGPTNAATQERLGYWGLLANPALLALLPAIALLARPARAPEAAE